MLGRCYKSPAAHIVGHKPVAGETLLEVLHASLLRAASKAATRERLYLTPADCADN